MNLTLTPQRQAATFLLKSAFWSDFHKLGLANFSLANRRRPGRKVPGAAGLRAGLDEQHGFLILEI